MGRKLRINITVDKDKLDKARTKLQLFGGKLSTLFNAYLSEFVSSMEKEPYGNRKETERRIREMEARIKRLENVKA